MDSDSSHHQSDNPKPKRLRTLAYSVKFPEGNTLLHQFVIDNSDPNISGSGSYINAVLLSMFDVPATIANALNDDGYCALHLAVLKKNLIMVKKLLSCLANIDVNVRCYRIRCRSVYGATALHLAAELGDVSIIQELLNKGASIDKRNNSGETALCYAAGLGHLDAIKLLVSKGANVDPTNLWCTPLCHAACYSDLEVVEFLVCSGADVNFRGIENPLCCAAGSGNLATVEFLVSNGADVNFKAHDNETPLHRAVRSESSEIVEYLVRNGADINAKNQRDETPLHYAVKARNSVIDRFLKCSSAWECHDVVRQGSLEIARLLIDQGADLRAIDEEGKTPLHDSVYGEDLKIAAFLLDQGKTWYGDHGWNAIYDARYRGCAKIVRTLLDKGADVNARNKDGETPLDLARNQLHIDALQMIDALINFG